MLKQHDTYLKNKLDKNVLSLTHCKWEERTFYENRSKVSNYVQQPNNISFSCSS